MAEIPFHHGEYVASAVQGSSFPVLRSPNGKLLPEIALLGKSNVGKSSLINHLLNGSRLARISSVPGKTRMINFFAVDQAVALVDLPGYGYAKVPKEMQKTWAIGLEEYLQTRQTLCLMLLLIDLRRTPSIEDFAMAEWSAHHKKPLVIIFTKSDKAGKGEEKKLIESKLASFSSIKNIDIRASFTYSIKEKNAREKLVSTINLCLKELHASS